ncbi:disease resistance protein RPM1-like [Populus nigra]|uniref:disease resistance protein RPM1-like n=1 Tax=Populus nigra TaxID=3691 RepID=UPI002B2763E7|nr:disease resistance protein RPM1-like [Populus nigra]
MQSKRTREEWERVLSSELGRLDEVDRDQVERGIFIPLLWSYYDLPSVVRRCFLYCAMFPKDYEMRKDELVKMWMAQGYLKETAGGDTELVGEQYFQVLASRSFFQEFETDEDEGMKFKMHDIVHDFAQYMTKNECLTVDVNALGEATVETSIERVSQAITEGDWKTYQIEASPDLWFRCLHSVIVKTWRLPNLESLELRSLKLRRLGTGFLGIEKDENASINEGEIARVTAFPKLKKLEIWNLKEVEEWDGIERRSVGEEDANTTSIISVMPQLRDLMIQNCPLLRALPDYVLAAPLQELFLSGCRNLRKRYGKEEMGEDWQNISHIPNICFDD